MKRLFPIFLFVLYLLPALQAADTLTIERKVQHTLMPSGWLRAQVWQNPAMTYYRNEFALSSIALNGLYAKRGEAALTQKGNGSQYADLHAESFLPLSDKSKVFGYAGYRSGKERNVLWNENDDVELLYPYFTGDSIGGDLAREEYYFMGGYACDFGQWSLGLKLSYRASISYRQKDPRPKNVISDLRANIGATRRLNDAYRLGVGLNVRNYDQNSQVDYFADQGSTSVYHLLGLGIDYVRFAGNRFDAIYEGWGMGGSIDLLPIARNGLSLSLSADHFGFTKALTSPNYVPIVAMDRTTLSFEAVWLKQTAAREYGIKFNAEWESRDGTENLFGDPTGNVYPKIGSSKMYTNQNLTARLSAVAAQNTGKTGLGWMAVPYIGFRQMKSEHKQAARSMEIANILMGIKGNVVLKTKGMQWTAGPRIAYTANLTSRSMFTGLDGNSSIGRALLSDFAYLSDAWFDFDFTVRGDYFLKNNKALFFTSGWLHQEYAGSGRTNCWQASVGFIF